LPLYLLHDFNGQDARCHFTCCMTSTGKMPVATLLAA
jgi:hypothetical protein